MSAPELDGFRFIAEEPFQVGAALQLVAVYRHELFAEILQLGDDERDARAEFSLVPGDAFAMGYSVQDLAAVREWDEESRGGLAAASPKREVELEPFLLARTPMTQAVWDGLTERIGVELWDQRYVEAPYLPIHGVTWSFLQDCLPELDLRLPSEAEWEYAAGAGAETAFFWGDSEYSAPDYAWYGHPYEGGPMGVAQKKPNAFGLFDVCGNIWELCADWWHDTYLAAPPDGRPWGDDPNDPVQRVMRGGSYRSESVSHLLTRHRSSSGIYASSDEVGFRPAAAPKFVTAQGA